MKSIQLLLIIGLLPICLAAQYNISMEAYIIDQETQQPISYANIGFESKSIGTVSSEKGRFYLNYSENKIKDTDVLKISRLGYQTLSFSAKEFYNFLTKTDKIQLQPTIESLEEVVIKPISHTKKTIGYQSLNGHNLMGYWKDKEGLGGEIGSLINLRKKNTKLHKLSFRITENTADSLLVRVNIYTIKKGMPDTNLMTSNVYHTISKKKGVENIDLSPYNIIVDDSFIIALELIKVYGDSIEFAIAAGERGKAYIRYVSQADWNSKYNTGIAFIIDASHPDKKTADTKRNKPNEITLYWDTSLSMQNRNINKELDLFKKYFSKLKKLKITIIPFSDQLREKKTIIIKNGNSKEFENYLKRLTYHGASDLSKLFKTKTATELYIISTDGISTFGQFDPQHETPALYINSKLEGNHKLLQDAGQFSDGHYINLSKLDVKKALQYMLFKKHDNKVYHKNKKHSAITGTVLTNNSPLQGCYVSIKGTLIESETDEYGVFKIDATIGDVLLFNHFGTNLQEKKITTQEDLTINLQPLYETLDEVQIKTSKKNTYSTANNERAKKDILNTSYTVTQDEFPSSAFYLSDVIRARFPRVEVTGNGIEAKYKVKGRGRWNSSSSNQNGGGPLWIIDGIQANQHPYSLTLHQIKSISLVRGLTSIYGPDGANGVFIIKTTMNLSDATNEIVKDTLLVQGNDYKESSFLIDGSKNRPKYLQELWDSNSYSEALEVYYKLQKNHTYEVPFYIYCSDYFRIWDKAFSNQIISCIAEVAKDNYKTLRVLAFKLEETDQTDKAVLIYEKLKELKPNYPQSYLDLARIYTLNEQYKKAYEVYELLITETDERISLEHCSQQLLSQFGNFLNNHRARIQNINIPKEYMKVRSIPVRIVFDWNDPQAEFELQFVNPTKKYFEWIHNYGDNSEQRIKELNKGMLSKEFIVDNSFNGQWIINVKSLGKKATPNNPVFMKYTIYKNYGLADETKEVKFLKLYNQTEKATIDKFIM